MKNKHLRTIMLLMVCIGLLPTMATRVYSQQIGIFENHSDVGKVLHAGTASFKPATEQYELSGSGTNIWGDHDEFQFMWKRMKGDFILYTRDHLLSKGTDPHRKIAWLVRTRLDSK